MKHVDLTTTPLTLHPFTLADAERVLSGAVDPHDGWEGGYAFTDVFATPVKKAAHGDSSGVRGAAWLWPLEAPA